MISYSLIRHDAREDKIDVANSFFNKAIKASNGEDLSPYISYAENIAITQQDKKEFTNTVSPRIEKKYGVATNLPSPLGQLRGAITNAWHTIHPILPTSQRESGAKRRTRHRTGWSRRRGAWMGPSAHIPRSIS